VAVREAASEAQVPNAPEVPERGREGIRQMRYADRAEVLRSGIRRGEWRIEE